MTIQKKNKKPPVDLAIKVALWTLANSNYDTKRIK